MRNTEVKNFLWLDNLLRSGGERNGILMKICRRLITENEHYDWVGFYIAEIDNKELVLGPFVGAPTEHVRIPYGRGICGRAAEALKTIVVQDVAGESNYLACSLEVKSEIVIPVFKDGLFVAELDIDSHQKASFRDSDRDYLENICSRIAGIF